MKFFSILALLIFTTVCRAQQTAYQALNVVGKAKGQTYLDRLLSLEGLQGNRKPASWRMIFEDSETRGGFREIEVRGGEIVSQRAPLRTPYESATRINLDRLQLDSDGAATLAARRNNRFTTANFLLQADGPSGNPVWRVELVGPSGDIADTVRISANDGSLLTPGQRVTSRSVPSSDYVGESVGESRNADLPEASESDGDSTELKIHRTLVHTGRNISNGFKRVGGSLQEIFTGRRTIDKDRPDQ